MMWYLGIDNGSTNLRIALLDEKRNVITVASKRTKGQPLIALYEILPQITKRIKSESVSIVATGSGKLLLSSRLNLPSINELITSVQSAELLAPSAASLIEIGGQFSKWMELDPTLAGGVLLDYSMNDLCAAGAGAFLEEQASRLQITVDELAELAAKAPRGASIAGRCSVFAKSDMIHLQQKGTPLSEIAYGLCLALARNFVATVLNGRELALPVAFIGGCAVNSGLIRAFRQLLDLKDEDIFTPDFFQYFGAIGAALSAFSQPAHLITINDLAKKIEDGSKIQHKKSGLKPLRLDHASFQNVQPRQFSLQSNSSNVFLGVDVGSVSTDLCLIGEDGEVIDGIYLATKGQPIEVLREGLEQLRLKYGDGLKIAFVGTTGSGRHLAARFLGTDVVKNEITAQLKGTAAFFPDVDTIFEIGGQDSKYISTHQGHIVDFTMNKICAAGTGSFLEEQAERLGISIIDEFSNLALSSGAPVDLGSRCTVFMDAELAHAQHRGVAAEDITAGLAYSIAKNYLQKVVASRKIGSQIVFQGGVASNQAVVAAFQNLLGKTINVHPYNRISGAIGAALLAKEEFNRTGKKTQFRGFGACCEYSITSFECVHCANRCQVNRISIGQDVVHFGDTCERYSSKEKPYLVPDDLPDLFGDRERLFLSYGIKVSEKSYRGKVGIPRTSIFYHLFPFWATLFDTLGYEVVLSSKSSTAMLAQALGKLPAETCLPVKITFGHVLDLLNKNVDFIFLPSIVDLASASSEKNHSYPCLYTETLPYLVRAAVQAKLLMPQISLNDDQLTKGLSSIADDLGVERREIESACKSALKIQKRFEIQLKVLGQDVLSSDFEKAVVILGRPYNSFDPFLNLNLARHLRRLGLLAIPMSFLPLDEIQLSDHWEELRWKFPRDVVKAVHFILSDERLFPIVVSNFGCGPDAFTHKHLEPLLENRPHLFLEFDEHRGEAGLITRLEAFADEIDTHLRSRFRQRYLKLPENHANMPEKGTQFFVPYFADHAYAFTAALRIAGYRAELLPPPDDESRDLGARVSSGKECHPFSLLIGDLLKLINSNGRDLAGVFFFPGTTMPCLLSQYGAAQQLALDKLGVKGVQVMAPDILGLARLLGPNALLQLWRGLVAIDLLIKGSCERRPYEVVAGETDRVHRDNLAELERALSGEGLGLTLKRCAERLESIELDYTKNSRPIVGVAGDIYTRINPFANEDLFYQLEDMGCEVWPAPFIVDTTEYGTWQEMERSFYSRKIGNFLRASIVTLAQDHEAKKIRQMLLTRLGLVPEPSYREVLDLAKSYTGPSTTSLVVLNVAKLVEFARRGAHGIINAYSFNCMVGNISAAILSKIRADHNQIPIVNLVYGGTEGSSQQIRLEAFVHQVKQFARHYDIENMALQANE